MGDNYLDLMMEHFLDAIAGIRYRRFDGSISEVEIYNYLEKITSGFDVYRVKAALQDIKVYHRKFSERRNFFESVGIIDGNDFLICWTIDMLETKLETKLGEQIPQISLNCSFSETEQKKLFDGLTDGGFLPKTANFRHFCYVFGQTPIPGDETPFKPLQWVATNKKTHGQNPNKVSLLDLLCLLDLPDNEIKNRVLLNKMFVFSNGTGLLAQNYTNHTDNKGKLQRPIISEHHNELSKIITSQ
jgi:hypothetical protein